MSEKIPLDATDAELQHMIAQQRLQDVTDANFHARKSGELHDSRRVLDNDALATVAQHAETVLRKTQREKSEGLLGKLGLHH